MTIKLETYGNKGLIERAQQQIIRITKKRQGFLATNMGRQHAKQCRELEAK